MKRVSECPSCCSIEIYRDDDCFRCGACGWDSKTGVLSALELALEYVKLRTALEKLDLVVSQDAGPGAVESLEIISARFKEVVRLLLERKKSMLDNKEETKLGKG